MDIKPGVIETIEYERDFKIACDGLLKFELGHLVQTFGSTGKDGGVDARFEGIIDAIPGKWIFQYKFRSPHEAIGRRRSWLSVLYISTAARKSEFDKDGVADADGYILLTNIPLTVSLVDKLAKEWQRRRPGGHFCAWDPSRLNVLMKGREHLARSWTGLKEGRCRSAIVEPLYKWVEDAIAITGKWEGDPLWPLGIEHFQELTSRPTFQR